MKRFSWVAILGLSLLVAVGIVIAAENNGPAVIKIDINKSGKKVPAFAHQKHQAMDSLKGKCIECHHTSKANEPMKDCGTCHTQKTEKDPATKAPGFKVAFHKKCLGCHDQQKDKPELKKCKTCHGE